MDLKSIPTIEQLLDWWEGSTLNARDVAIAEALGYHVEQILFDNGEEELKVIQPKGVVRWISCRAEDYQTKPPSFRPTRFWTSAGSIFEKLGSGFRLASVAANASGDRVHYICYHHLWQDGNTFVSSVYHRLFQPSATMAISLCFLIKEWRKLHQ